MGTTSAFDFITQYWYDINIIKQKFGGVYYMNKNRIIINNGILEGKPIIKGTRISVELIIELLAGGMAEKEILKEYPQLKKNDILAALEYAARTLKSEEIIIDQRRAA